MTHHALCTSTAVGLIHTLASPAAAGVTAWRDPSEPGRIRFARPRRLFALGRKVKVYIGDEEAGDTAFLTEIAQGEELFTSNTGLTYGLFIRVYVTDLADTILDSVVVQTIPAVGAAVVAPTAAGALPDLTLTEGVAMSADLSGDFTDGGGTLTFALAPSSAALPAGLSLSTAGTLSGTPTAAASSRNIVVRATNSASNADSAFSLTVEAAAATNTAPVANSDTATVTAGGSVQIDVLANDTDLDGDTLSVTAASADIGSVTIGAGPGYLLTFDATGLTNGQTATISYTVSDGTDTDTGTATVNVIAEVAAPSVVGRDPARTLNDPSTDPLPTGWAWESTAGGNILVTQDDPAPLEDWPVNGTVRGDYSGAVIRQCRFALPNGAGSTAYIFNPTAAASGWTVENNDLFIPLATNEVPDMASPGALINIGADVAGWTVRANHLWNYPYDGGKFDGRDMLIEFNRFGLPKNLPDDVASWDSAVTYAPGDVVTYPGSGLGTKRYTKIDSSSAGAEPVPFEGADEGRPWEYEDPHVDMVTITGGQNLVFRHNTFDEVTLDTLVGATQQLRVIRNTGTNNLTDGVLVCGNTFTDWPAYYPVDAGTIRDVTEKDYQQGDLLREGSTGVYYEALQAGDTPVETYPLSDTSRWKPTRDIKNPTPIVWAHNTLGQGVNGGYYNGGLDAFVQWVGNVDGATEVLPPPWTPMPDISDPAGGALSYSVPTVHGPASAFVVTPTGYATATGGDGAKVAGICAISIGIDLVAWIAENGATLVRRDRGVTLEALGGGSYRVEVFGTDGAPDASGTLVVSSGVASVTTSAAVATSGPVWGSAENIVTTPGTLAPSGTITPDELSKDGVVFGSRGPQGLRTALFLEKGSADASLDGQVIQAETQIDGVTQWVDVGTVVEGRYSGWIEYERRAAKYTRRARVKYGDGTTFTASTGPFVGHFPLRITQSDETGAFTWGRNVSSEPFAPTVQYPDLMEYATAPRLTDPTEPLPAGVAKLLPVRNDAWIDQFEDAPAPLNSHLCRLPVGVAMAVNEIGGEDWGADGMKILMIGSMQNGQGIQATADNEWGNRFVSDERQIIEAGITDPEFGQTPDLVSIFVSSDNSLDDIEPEFFGRFVFGLNPDGSAFDPSVDDKGTGIDWTLAQHINWGIARLAVMAPWSEAFQEALQRVHDTPAYTGLFARHWKQRDYGNYLVDGGHPTKESIYGGGYVAIQTMYAQLMNAEMIKPGPLAADRIEIHPNGDTKSIRLGWSVGDLTTGYLKSGLPDLTGTPDVFGYTFNGQELVGDNCRIRDDAGDRAERGSLWLRKPDGTDISIADVALFKEYDPILRDAGGSYTNPNSLDFGATGIHDPVTYENLFRLAVAPGRNGFISVDRSLHFPVFTDFASHYWEGKTPPSGDGGTGGGTTTPTTLNVLAAYTNTSPAATFQTGAIASSGVDGMLVHVAALSGSITSDMTANILRNDGSRTALSKIVRVSNGRTLSAAFLVPPTSGTIYIEVIDSGGAPRAGMIRVYDLEGYRVVGDVMNGANSSGTTPNWYNPLVQEVPGSIGVYLIARNPEGGEITSWDGATAIAAGSGETGEGSGTGDIRADAALKELDGSAADLPTPTWTTSTGHAALAIELSKP